MSIATINLVQTRWKQLMFKFFFCTIKGNKKQYYIQLLNAYIFLFLYTAKIQMYYQSNQ